MALRISKKCIICGICAEVCPEAAVRDDLKSDIYSIEEVKWTVEPVKPCLFGIVLGEDHEGSLKKILAPLDPTQRTRVFWHRNE